MVKPYRSELPKKEQVRTMFERIAPRYDLLNHTLSLNVDRLWRRRAVGIVREGAPRRILDVATGTGDLALAMARRMPAAEVVGIDLSPRMLEAARRKAAERGLERQVAFAEGDAERLEADAASFDAATVAFGVRNFGDLEAGLRELARVLRPGGRVVILEFSRPRNRLFRAFYEFYTGRILPRIGGAVSHDAEAYAYLPASVAAFASPEELLALLSRVGFTNCRARSQSCGIAQIYTGTR